MKNLITTLILMTLVSCATQTKKEIAKEAQAVDAPADMGQVMHRYSQSIQNSITLSEDQKNKMMGLQRRTYRKVQGINTQIKKLKIVMLDNLMSKDYDQRKVDIISKQIKNLNKDRMDLMLDSLADAKRILGKVSTDPSLREIWYFHDAY